MVATGVDFQDAYPQSDETKGVANLRAIVEHYAGGALSDQGRSASSARRTGG